MTMRDGRRIRYIGIDAPEIAHHDSPGEHFGQEAGKWLYQTVMGKKVRLEWDKERKDQYGRWLAYVFSENGTFVNAELVKRGYATVFFKKPNNTYHKTFLALQRSAMKRRAGLWKKFPQENIPLIGNRRSRRFHRVECPYGKSVSKKNRRHFKSTYDAYWEGYSPCKKCGNVQD